MKEIQIPPSTIITASSSEQAYLRGMKLYREHAVEALEVADTMGDDIFLNASVQSSTGKQFYDVELEYNVKKNVFTDFWCECKAFMEYRGLCKHCVAAALAYNTLVTKQKSAQKAAAQKNTTTSYPIQHLLQELTEKQKQVAQQQTLSAPVELVPILERAHDNTWKVEFRIGTPSRYYVLKDLPEFVQQMQCGMTVRYGKKLEFAHTRTAFAPKSLPVLDFILEQVTMDEEIRKNILRYWGNGTLKRNLPLSAIALLKLLRIVDGGILVFSHFHGEVYCPIASIDNLRLPIRVQQEKTGYQLILPAAQFITDGQQYCLFYDGKFLFCSAVQTGALQAISSLLNAEEEKEYFIAQADLPAFCAALLPRLTQIAEFDTAGLEVYQPIPCQLRVYLDDDGVMILCRAEACYGENVYALYQDSGTAQFNRDFEQEYRLRAVLEQYFPVGNNKEELHFLQEDDERLYELLTQGIEQIAALAEVYLSDRIRCIQVQRPPKLQVGVSLSGGLLNLDIESERLPQHELQGLLDSYRQRRRYYRLKNGDFLQLEEGPLSTLAELADGLALSSQDLQRGTLQIPQYSAYYVDQVLREGGESVTVQRDMNFRSLIRNLKNYEDSDDEVPGDLQTTLRQYQQVGYQWLMTLLRMGLGGILADDMGLGKTVQVIAVLLAHQERLREKPALIVTPASLVYNWESELHRFAPVLQVQAVTGTAGERKKLLQQNTAQVLLTSYDLLKRDVALYEQQAYALLVIDEAQNIKNHTTKAAKTVKALRADNRLALTGTPIENRLSELWSIFDFLLPGMLGRYEAFRQNYELAIVQQNDAVTLKRLQKMIQPFILRRLKQDVLKDLPEKTENVVYSKMDTAQRTLYVANVQRMLDLLDGKTDAQVHSEKLQILAELTRLRQLCCDPSLLYTDYKGGSAKLDTCMELLDSALQSGSKVLVFSQFTTMLERIRLRLDEKNIASFLLTGATSKERRAELVQRFNETEEAQIFLISLKAGGTGLNLTAASVVIHVDPWWNAAAQEQATDRAHRIGQKQAVSVFQLITKDTIEEKIRELQERKMALSQTIISGQGMSMASLSKEELLEIFAELVQSNVIEYSLKLLARSLKKQAIEKNRGEHLWKNDIR